MTQRVKATVVVMVAVLLAIIWSSKVEFDASAHEGHHAPASAKKLKNPLTVTEADIKRGGELYDEHCASCHGTNGQAKTEVAAGMKVKPTDLTGKVITDLTEGEIYWVITNGIKASGMPVYKVKLNDRARWQITLYIQRFPPGATASAQTIAALNKAQLSGAPLERHPMKGKILSIDKQYHQVIIEHEEIPGYMGAMAMPFPLKDEKLYDLLKVGNQIRATLVVAQSAWWLDEVVVIPK